MVPYNLGPYQFAQHSLLKKRRPEFIDYLPIKNQLDCLNPDLKSVIFERQTTKRFLTCVTVFES